MEIGPESLKLKKLVESDDNEAHLTTFERALEDQKVERKKWSAFWRPNLQVKHYRAYDALSNEDSKDFKR